MNHWEDHHGTGYTICEVEENHLHEGDSVNGTSANMAFLRPINIQFISEGAGLYQQHHSGWAISENLTDVKEACEDIDIDVYIETFIVCLCCLPTTIATLYCIQYISKKILLCESPFQMVNYLYALLSISSTQ